MRTAESATPPHPYSFKKLLEFVQISRPTLAEVGWARAHPWLRQWLSVDGSGKKERRE